MTRMKTNHTNDNECIEYLCIRDIRVIRSFIKKKADTRVWDISHLESPIYLLSKHGRHGRFQPCPVGRSPSPPHSIGVRVGLRKTARRSKLTHF